MTKHRLRLTAVAALIMGGGFAAFTYGCSGDEDPPAAKPDSGTPDTGGTATPDATSGVDLPNCGHCVNALSSTCRTKAFCQHNDTGDGKSSTALLLAVNACTCTEQCATECGQVCTGQGDIPPECATCTATKCTALFAACLADTNPTNEDGCNDPFGGTDGGSDAATGDGGGDASTDDAGDGG